MVSLYLAIGKSMLARYLVYGVSLLSLMTLTRVFTPSVFGVMAAVLTIVTFLQLVAEGGLAPAIINLDRWHSHERNGVFGLSLLAGMLLAITLVALTPILSGFFRMPGIRAVGLQVAISLLMNTSAVVPLALLQRQQLFFDISKAGVVAELVALASACAAIRVTPELQAYALYFPIKATVNFVMLWLFSARTEFGRPLPGIHILAIRPLLRTTSFQLGFNFVNYFSRNLDNILVGRYLGAVPLGIYDRSYQLMRYPLQLLTFAMTPAIQPVLRSMTHSPDEVFRLHRDLAFKLALAGSAIAILVFFTAKPLVILVLGNQWLDVVPIIRLLSLIIPVQVILSTSGSFFQAFNRTDLLFYCGLFSSVTNSLAIIASLKAGGLEALCWGLFISFHLCFLQTYQVMHKYLFNGGMVRFLVSIWPMGVALVVLVTAEVMNVGHFW